jgi:hypothetical protein
MTIAEIILKWQINPSILAKAMKIPEDAFVKKLNQHNFSNDEILELDKAVKHLREDLRSVQPPVKKPQLSKEQIDDVCNEIEHQWLHLVMTRAVFSNTHFPKVLKYKSPSFYSDRQIQFGIEILTPNTENFKRGAHGLNSWHNKNYVIRLYGILDKHEIMKYGRKVCHSDLMELIYCLRPKIGAHNSGRKPRDKDDIKAMIKATDLINKLFPQSSGKKYDLKTVTDYWLPIKEVLEPMKKQAI